MSKSTMSFEDVVQRIRPGDTHLIAEKAKREYPVGSRIRLIQCLDPWTNLSSGSLGTVSLVDAVGTVHVNWDNGSRLGMIIGEDIFVLEGANNG